MIRLTKSRTMSVHRMRRIPQQVSGVGRRSVLPLLVGGLLLALGILMWVGQAPPSAADRQRGLHQREGSRGRLGFHRRDRHRNL